VAISGGVLVFRGLWIENKADKDEFLDVDDFRSSKLKKKRGWKMLMWGIALETLVAGVFAAKDGWEIRQTNAKTPGAMQVNSVLATADLFVNINADDSGIRWGLPGYAAHIIFSDIRTNKFTEDNLRVVMFCKKETVIVQSWSATATNLEIVLKFGMNSTATEPSGMEWAAEDTSKKALKRSAEELIKDLNFCSIHPDFLDGNIVNVHAGKVTLLLNGSISRTFIIPHQVAHVFPFIVTTNGALFLGQSINNF
jgi:hypothetical protein